MTDTALAPNTPPDAPDDVDRHGSVRAFVVAGGLGVVALLLGWRGADFPAQIYRADLVRRYGFVLWNGQWYGGHPTLPYSVLAPVAGALVGPAILALASGLVAAVGFDRLVRHQFGAAARIGSAWFACSTVTNLIVGRVAFAFGLAFGMLAVVALQRHRRGWSVWWAVLTSLSSPVAGVFLAIAAVACGLGDRSERRAATAIAIAAVAPIGVITLLFPSEGTFPYRGASLVWDLAVCAVFAAVVWREHVTLRWGAALYAVASLGAFIVPSAMGGNIARLGQYIAGPVIACILWPTRKVLLGVLAVPLLVWQWAPTVDAMTQSRTDLASQRAYYAHLTTYLLDQKTFGRVEIPFTFHHWETVYVAEDVPLARGWERQLDIGNNKVFYDGTLDAANYRAWLADNAVAFVALPDTKLDPSSLVEKQIIERGLPNLRQVWSDTHWTVWQVTDFHSVVTGPAVVVGMTPTSFTLDITGHGPVGIKVRPSAHWAVDGPGCTRPDGKGWMELDSLPLGRVVVSQALSGTPCP